jgi:hypothetical protein
VVNSAAVADQFRDLLEQVRGTERAASVAAEARWILGELARAPAEFGESWFPHPGGQLVFRRGSSGPLFVEYAFDAAARVVYLRRFALHGQRREG